VPVLGSWNLRRRHGLAGTSPLLWKLPLTNLFFLTSNEGDRLLSSQPWSFNGNQVYSIEGADAVIIQATQGSPRTGCWRATDVL